MSLPVKVSDRLLALAREEAQGTHRSMTAQIEHWANLGRAVEVMVSYRDVLALKSAGQTFPVPAHIRRGDLHDLLMGLVAEAGRGSLKARIRAAGTPVYTTDPAYPGMLVEVREAGTRVPGHLKGRRFVVDGSATSKDARKRKQKARRDKGRASSTGRRPAASGE